MRHRKSGRRLGRNTSHRKAMMRNMVTSLFEHEKVTTTDARAKELRKTAEKLVTLAKRGDLHARRLVLEVVRDKKVVAKLFETIAPRYSSRPGGYTRIIKLGHRSGDNAAMSVIELVEEEFTPKPKAKKQPEKATALKEKTVAVEPEEAQKTTEVNAKVESTEASDEKEHVEGETSAQEVTENTSATSQEEAELDELGKKE